MIKPQHRKLCYQAAQALAIASAVFMLLAGGILIANQFGGKVGGLMKSTELARLTAELKKLPKSEVDARKALTDQIWELDLRLRQETFYQLNLSQNAVQGLVWSLIVFLASVHLMRNFRASPPNPLEWGPRDSGEERSISRIGRYAVAVVFGLTVATGAMVSLHPVQLPGPKVEVPEVPATATELAANWISFRGPDGLGYFKKTAIPLGWDPKADKGVLWKTEVPLAGMSSPVRWNNALFLTSASKDENRVLCFDAETGAKLWSSVVKPAAPGPKPGDAKVNDGTGLAAPTTVTDGRRVYAMFANGDIAAFKVEDGKQVWARNLGLPENSYGYSCSLLVCADKVLIQFDVGSEEDGKSKMIALQARTGQEAWSVKREVGGGWTSPALVSVDGKPQVIAAGNPWVVAYNPADGAELWKAKVLHGDVAPSPLLAGGMVIVTAPGAEMLGLRPGNGEAAWKLKEGVPETSSPGSDGQRVYSITSGGALNCIDAATGKLKWTEELGEEGYASPVIGANGVLVVQRNGTMLVVANADSYKLLHKAELGEPCDATPLLYNGRIYVRGQKHLFCLGGVQNVAKP